MLTVIGVMQAFAAFGQLVVPLPPKPPPLPEAPAPAPPPALDAPAHPPFHPGAPLEGARIIVKKIQLVGNTAFTSRELSDVTAKYVDRPLAMEDLESLRLELTLFYMNRGYVTSGAIIPDQTSTEPVLTVQIIEGKLAEINLEGTRWFRSSYFHDRLSLSAGPPVNVDALRERLQILQSNPRVERINAELRPGLVRGESVLDVRVKDANPFQAWLEFNNFLSPAVGAEQGAITLVDHNFLGLSDTLTLQYGGSAGAHPILNFSYSLPVSARDTTISLYYRRFDFSLVEEPFDALDITNRSHILGATMRQPLFRTPRQEFGLSVGFDYEENRSFLGKQPVSFVQGATNGVFKLAVLRLTQDWVHRGEHQVFSVLSRFSIGIGALGATTTPTSDLPDGRFFSWLGEAQWLRQLPFWRTQLLGRGLVQLSNDHLFPLEQTFLGGRASVRGYRAFSLIRDNAAQASLEARVPVYRTAAGRDALFLAPFVDFGHGWHTTIPTPSDAVKTLASVGVGAIATVDYAPRLKFLEGSYAEIYWGQQLNHFRGGHGNLQDHGVYVQVVLRASP
jgi:hemolysin activation/secretion protein